MMISLIRITLCLLAFTYCFPTTSSQETAEANRNDNNLDSFFATFFSATSQQNDQSGTEQDAGHGDAVKQCKTKACMDLKESILSNMDASYKPCEDMYMYACGGMLKRNGKEKVKQDASVFGDLLKQEEKVLKKAIEGLKGRKEKDAYKKVYDWYSACLNSDEKKKLGITPLLKMFKSIGTWPLLNDDWSEENWDLEKVLALVYRDFGESPLFDIGVGNDPTNVVNSSFKFEIAKPSLPLETEDFYLKKTRYTDEVLFAYFKLLVKLTKLFQKEAVKIAESDAGNSEPERDTINIVVIGASNQFLQRMIDVIEVVKVEMKIAKAMSLKKSSFIPPHTTLGKLHDKYGDDVFNWKRFISLLYKGLHKQPPFKDSEEIYIKEKTFFKEIMNIIATTEPRILANLIMIRILYEYGGNLSPEFRAPYLEFYGTVYGIKKFSKPWERCIRSTKKDIMFPVTALFVKDTLPEPDLAKAEDLVNQLAKAYLKHMDQVKWMDKPTREAAQKKIKSMMAHVAYPREIRNMTALNRIYSGLQIDPDTYFDNVIRLTKIKSIYTLDMRGKNRTRNSWGMEPTEVNAQYTEETNKIVVGAGLLQRPIFNRDYPRARTYGSIGMAIGHEMTHGFDGTGARYDEVGNFHDWWSHETYKKFKDKMKCMIQEYSKFTVYHQHLNGNQTIDENIADNGGLRIAYEAYCRSLKEQGEDLALPGINLTSKKLFFLSYGQLWCKYKTKASAIHSLHTDVHSPAKARVNYVLKNMKEFSETFGCPKGSPMNPEKKCVIW